NRAPVTFTPSSADATFSCSTITMKLLGDQTVAPPFTLVEIDLAASTAVGQDVPLWLDTNATTAHSSDDKVAFSIQASSNLDDSPLSSVVVTPDALPTADGELVKVELQLTFEDGRVLDQVYTAPVTIAQGQCGN
ncbi:MAG TPA: hypothetical protein VGH87_10335, partial [Polyangiaceae bacterium]